MFEVVWPDMAAHIGARSPQLSESQTDETDNKPQRLALDKADINCQKRTCMLRQWKIRTGVTGISIIKPLTK